MHIYWVFLYTTFQRILLYGRNGRVSIVDNKEILLLNVVGLKLNTDFKSEEDNQGIQLKRMLIKGPVSKPYKIVPLSFRLTFRKRTMVRFLLLFISRAWDVLILFVFPYDYICAFLIVWKTQPVVVFIVF